MEMSADIGFQFAEFLSLLERELQWPIEQFNSRSRLIDDCGLDSMGMYELLLIMEENGWIVDEDTLLSWVTIGDVYEAYLAK